MSLIRALLLAVLAVVAACGQTGPLYPPPAPAETDASTGQARQP
jgi:predicted small lipoprotein YifL